MCKIIGVCIVYPNGKTINRDIGEGDVTGIYQSNDNQWIEVCYDGKRDIYPMPLVVRITKERRV